MEAQNMYRYLESLIGKAIRQIEYLHGIELPRHGIERPKVAAHGDYATNVALIIATQTRRPPLEVARDIVQAMHPDPDSVQSIDIIPPGFINVTVTAGWLRESLRGILRCGSDFSRVDVGHGQRVQIEFVSANPTGPLNIVSARAAAVGDALASILGRAGYQVEKEFYINDAGRQIDLLAESIDVICHRLRGIDMEIPEGGYRGDYVEAITRDILAAGDPYAGMETGERLEAFRTMALRMILAKQKEILQRFGLVYDVWFSERTLRESGAVERVLARLTEGGYVFVQDKATWFRSTAFGDEKDRVLVTSDGNPTYLLGDIAYHENKFERGFERIIDLWGPDHHGHIARMKAAVEALGHDPQAIELRIVQQVNLFEGGEKVKMSKREGRLITMEELLDEVGVDVARFFFLMRKTSAHLDFDLDLAKQQSDENPVFYIQYAYARICSIISHAAESGIEQADPETVNLSLLSSAEEMTLIKRLLIYPEVIEKCALSLEPHGLTTYLQDVAAAFHPFYHNHRVVTSDLELTRARLFLVEAVRFVLREALSALGISAPEKM